ncbi:MAG: RNA polymerase sigma factor [bacterium]
MSQKSTSYGIASHAPQLRRYAHVLYSFNPLEAEDLVQDTLERALLKMDQWQPDSSLRKWLFSIMHSLYVNQIRSAKAKKRTAPDYEQGRNQTISTDILDVRSALKSLSIDQREVLTLIAVEGFTYTEVANILDIPTGTVMSRLSRAREHMRQMIEVDQPVKLRVMK